MIRLSNWLRTHPEARLILIAAAIALVLTTVVVVSIAHERAQVARPVAQPAATSTAAPPAEEPSATPTHGSVTHSATPDDAAKAFADAYLSWEWDRSMPAMQAGVRPYVTGDLYERLATEPSPQWTNPGGVDVHEVDTPRVVSATPLDSDAAVARVLVAALVTQRRDTGSTEHPVALVLRINRDSGGWKVDEVDR